MAALLLLLCWLVCLEERLDWPLSLPLGVDLVVCVVGVGVLLVEGLVVVLVGVGIGVG